MPDPVARDGVRSVTLAVTDDVFSELVALSRRNGLLPAVQATELLKTGLAAGGGPRSDVALGAVTAGPEDRGASPPAPALPMVRSRPERPVIVLLPERRWAALTPRAQVLRGTYRLSYLQAAILDMLLEGATVRVGEIFDLLPVELQPGSIDSIRTSIARIRHKTALGFEHLSFRRGAGCSLSQAGRDAVIARVEGAA